MSDPARDPDNPNPPSAQTVRDSTTPTLDPTEAASPGTTRVPAGLSPKPESHQIGNYKLLEAIGEGGFGVVWVADQTWPVKRRVALKIIKPGMDSKAVIARFEQERQALAIMDHPNIAKVFDAGTSPDGRPYFVMEYVPGESITGYCDRNRLTVDQRLGLFVATCEAVQHAHHKGIIHRDIKPGNVLVTVASGEARVKVIDFGVAKAVSHHLTDKTLFTEHGQILGTPEYMSPEQAEMGALDIDTRTDVYALGVLLYELLTGALPFEPNDLRSRGYKEIQRIIREVDPPRPSARLRSLGKISAEIAKKRQAKLDELEGQLRRELEWIPLKAMRKNRNERYATPVALADDIRNHLAGRPLVAGPESTLYRAKKFVVRNRWAVSAAAMVALALLVGAIVSTIGFVRAARNAELYRQARDQAEAEADRANAEAARLRQINIFINTMLSSADPSKGDRRDVTVRELLEDAGVQLESGALQGLPRIESAVRATLAQTFQSLSLWQAAELQWRKAMQLESDALGADSLEAAAAMAGLGRTLVDARRLDEAEKSLQQALAIRRESLPPDDLLIADTINDLGVLADRRGDLVTAQRRYRDALEIFQNHPQQTGRQADAMTNLATTFAKSRNYSDAIDLSQRALELRRLRFGSRSTHVWNSLINLGQLQESQGDLLAAERTRREALSLAGEVVEEKHRMTILSLDALARTLWLRGGSHLEEAERLQSRSLDLARQVDGAQSLSTARQMDLLGQIARDRNRPERSVELFREELRVRRSLQPPDHPDVAAAMSRLADVLTRAGQAAEAVELAKSALEVRKRILPAGDWQICNTTSVLGGAYVAAGDFESAEPLLLDAYKGLEGSKALAGRPRRETAARLAELYDKAGKPQDAQRWRETIKAMSAATQP